MSWRSGSRILGEIEMVIQSLASFFFGSGINQFCDFEQVL